MSSKFNSCVRIGIIHPQLTESGGSEAAAVYIADALKER